MKIFHIRRRVYKEIDGKARITSLADVSAKLFFRVYLMIRNLEEGCMKIWV